MQFLFLGFNGMCYRMHTEMQAPHENSLTVVRCIHKSMYDMGRSARLFPAKTCIRYCEHSCKHQEII